MGLRSLGLQRCVLSLAAVFFVSACTDDGRPVPLSEVDLVPPATPETEVNINIDNPTLTIAETFSVSAGEVLTMVWNDEFDGAKLDPEVWFFATGDGTEKGLPGGWGNNELQYYLPDSAVLEDGKLKITARQESIEGLNYTSARLNTEDRFAFKYGRIEASIKLPSGQGLWPAFWMLSQDSPYGTWAATGEIDIVETVNLDGTGGNEIFGTLHFGGEFPANDSQENRYTPSVDITEDFHTYAVEWDENEFRWYFDDTLYAVQTASWFSTAAPFPAPFDQPFHILLNLAVGGNFPGPPDGNTVFPATMEVDWVRVYSGEEGTTETPADPGTVPDVIIFAPQHAETPDLVLGEDYTGLDPFGSGSVFDGESSTDTDFNPAFAVTTGDGYGAQVGQLGVVGFTAGFASEYGSFDFKIKNVNNDLIRVKFLDAGDYLDITLTSSAFATALGNDWYQVAIPLVSLTGVDTATGLLLETDNTAANSFTFLLTDVGFSGTGGGGPNPGIVPEVVIYATDQTEMIDLVLGVDYTGIEAFGSGATLNNASTGDPDFDPAYSVLTGNGYGAQVGQLGFVGFGAGFAMDYGTVNFKIKDVNNDLIRVKFLDDGDYLDITLTSSPYATALGNGWYQVSAPLSAFSGVDTATGLLFETDNLAASAFTFLLTDIGFSGSAGGGDCAVTPAGEIATNGGFETGDLSCFEIFDNNGSISAVNTESSSGTWSVHVVAGPGNNPVVKLERRAVGTVLGGDIINVSFDMKGAAAAGGVVFPELISEGAGGATVSNLLDTIAAPTAGWTTYNYSPAAAADVSGGITFQLAIVCGGDPACSNDVYIDNISVVIP